MTVAAEKIVRDAFGTKVRSVYTNAHTGTLMVSHTNAPFGATTDEPLLPLAKRILAYKKRRLAGHVW